MSLFKSKDWWSSGTALDETTVNLFNASLKVSQIGPEGSGDVVIFGAPNGLIQIFRPQGSYQPTDVVLEFMTDKPILQIDTGKLMPGSNTEHIVVLHPRSISVYLLSSKEGHTEYGNQNVLLEQYEHKLPRAAYCFIVGPFGNIKERDFICVQSLDGLLMFFEQDVSTFSCFLPNFLLPGEICYSHCADAFITCNSNWVIEAFSYHNLSQISDVNDGKSIAVKKPVADWEYNVGENIISMQKIQVSNNICAFVLLGERCLYCLNDNGLLKFMKKFDFEPICSHAYLIGWYYENNARFMVMVISETSTLLIYEQATLLWSCQLTFSPVCINRGFFTNLPGSLVMLTDYGEVKCCYLGTEPELFTAPPLPSNEVNFDEAQVELEKLQVVINSQNDISEINLSKAASERELPFTIFIDKNLIVDDNFPKPEDDTVSDDFYKCKVEVKIKPLDRSNIELMQVTFVTQDPIVCSDSNQLITDITDDISVESEVYIRSKVSIGTFNIGVVVLFTNSLGQIRILKKDEQLPFQLIYRFSQPKKDSKYKVTLATNKSTIDLLDLFNDFKPETFAELGLSTGVVAFSSPYCDDSIVTIIAAKSSQRYRIQCDNISTMAGVIKEFIHRLLMYFNKRPHLRDGENALLKVILYGEISQDILHSFMNSIEQHTVTRQELVNVEKSLDVLSSQFILIQKRLMIKYRERPPTSCEGLALLLEDTVSKINKVSSDILKLKLDVFRFGCEINCGIHLIFTLLDLIEPKIENLDIIRSALSTDALHDCHQAWEETAVLNALYLLRTIFAKNEKERDKFVPLNSDDSIVSYNVKDIIKYIRLLLERVINRKESSPDNDAVVKEEQQLHLDSDVDAEYKDDNVFNIPEGSLYGQRQPILTARLEKQNRIE